MSFRTRLLAASLSTLVVGLGALLVLGNVLLAQRVKSETSSLLRARAQAQVAALVVGPGGVRVRETANDEQLDKQAWVLAGDRVIERPAGVSPGLDRAAVAFGREGRAGERDGPGDVRLRAQPVRAAGAAKPAATVVVGLSEDSLEKLQGEVLIGSLVIAALILLAGGLAIRSAVDGALRPVAEMTEAAADWGAHDLEHRFGLGPPRDELTGLAATLDGLLARIAASRRHEQRFASEVAHELRTPVAGLRGRVELALRAEGPTCLRWRARSSTP
jgi:signal transduction histidine kinase